MGGEWLTLKDGKVDISGYAPGAVRAFLYLNNRETGGTTVEDQGFVFRQVPLDYGVNVIEVKVMDDAGGEANSMAGIVERESQSMAKVREDSVLNRQRGPRELPWLALTIDAGASNQRAEKILDVLRAKGIVTTFFLTGQFIERYPELTKRIVADGHEVGNHTYDHPHLTTYEQNRRHYTSPGVTRELVQTELLKTKDLFEKLTGAHMVGYWRAPYGEYNSDILAWAKQAGFKHVDWTRTPLNFDMLDWVADEDNGYYLTGQGLLHRLTGIDRGVSGGANGGIILMHLGTDRRKDFMDEVLPQAIDALRQRDYKFVTISRMFSRQ
jgi:peptidoglycan/xylan/chitin deacetylase (PgdA/CDA1 family)